MAQKTAADKKKTPGSKPKTKPKNNIPPEPEPKAPVRRAVGGCVCLLLAIFTLLGYFTSDGIFIEWFSGFLRGIIGGGFYYVAPMLIIASLMLFFHHGKPVTGRLVCVLLLPAVVGMLYQLFDGTEYELSLKIIGSLWKDGREMVGGGAVSGFLSELFKTLFSRIGAAIFIILALILMVMFAAWDQIMVLRKKYRERPRYEPEEEETPEQKEKPKKDQPAPVQNDRGERKPRTASDIDIPVDDPINPRDTKKRPSLFNKNPAVQTPDELITGQKRPKESEPVQQETKTEPQPEQKQERAPEPEKPAQQESVLLNVPPITVIPNAPPVQKPEAEEKKDESVFVPPEETQVHASSMYRFPPLTLLAAETSSGSVDASFETTANKDRLEKALASFGINSKVSKITRGPSVTRYEVGLEAGVKLNRLTNLADDIALSLGASGVRIAAIPNKISTVGIEVPNKTISRVYLRDIIDTTEFRSADSKLTFAIGKNISGEAIVGNISKLPHMLVAGTTGSGKSVCLNSLILSILYKATPDEVKFIMIDPKMVEFKVYNGIPHLLVPVVTEAKKAAGALQWAVTEMMKRYRTFSDTSARDIASYNALCDEAEEGTEMRRMPHIVVVIDELADLMLVASKEVEEAICRVAQMGRAAGVHLVIATQSPRADVITGLMKANIPSRIALKVSSSLESRIILDAGGAADKLVGNGDMLYAPIGTSKPMRVQGTWVSDEERENIVKFVKKSGEAEYSEDVIAQIEKAAEGKQSKQETAKEEPKNDYDELLPQAVDVIFETGQASVSMLQRRLKLGYARAARLVDQMEELGVVGPFEGSKPRQILITKPQWQEMQFVQGTAPVEQLSIPVDKDTAEQTLFTADDLFEEK